ncbi:ABC transporter ATP-binding protein [Desulfotruncus alcoholivorax]|uniref:ABC transporter ATP-binding protein n=1 Tax=Desulfotruncus alcoholivorax TaxID=265477 RepID=UPI00041B4D57|nr:oligopeptide/dipeptide ABC transporter ATP-binding protein [Desulfotruncus alcoholivorax]
MEPLIKTIDLKKYFKVNGGLLHAVDGVNIEIKKGRTLGVVGESGCGKSTLGRLVIRLLEATSGEVLFEGNDILKCNRQEMKKIRPKMQIIFQDPFSSLNPRMSVFELIAEPLVMNHVYKSRREMTEKILSLMDTVGLAERFVNTYPHEMDGGRRQRVGIARALALSPKFIVCDEPVSALDVSIQAQILNLLMDLQEEMKLTYMFITHDLSVVKHISNEIAVMYLGQCIERAESTELFKNPMHPYTKALLSAIPVPRLTGNQNKKIIRGEVSDPINPKPGCRFASRCDYCKDHCLGQDIPLKDQGNEHFVACRIYQ